MPGYANNVDVVGGDFAYVAAGAAGLQVVDVSDLEGVGNLPPNRIVGSLDTPGTAIDIKVSDSLAYIADGASGLQIHDVSDPTAPVLVGAVDTPGIAQDVRLQGNRAYIADGTSGLAIIDITDPTAPSVLGAVNVGGTAKGVDVSGNPDHAVVVTGGPSVFHVVDITNENAPVVVGSVAIPGSARDVVIRDDHAFVTAFTGGFNAVDFSTPTAPQIVDSIPGSGAGFVPRDAELSGQFALAAEQLFPHAVPIVNIAEPSIAGRPEIDAAGNHKTHRSLVHKLLRDRNAVPRIIPQRGEIEGVDKRRVSRVSNIHNRDGMGEELLGGSSRQLEVSCPRSPYPQTPERRY